jgi:hypothetical protein
MLRGGAKTSSNSSSRAVGRQWVGRPTGGCLLTMKVGRRYRKMRLMVM